MDAFLARLRPQVLPSPGSGRGFSSLRLTMASRKSLQTGLLISFLLVSMVPILLVGLFSQRYLTRKTSDTIQKKNEMLADTLALEISGRLNEALTILTQVAGFLHDHPHNSNEVNAILDGAVHRSGFFECICLVDRDGRVRFMGVSPDRVENREDYIGQDFPHRAQFRETLILGRPQWSDTFVSSIKGELSLTLSIPFGREVMAASFSLARMGRAVERMRLESGLQAMIVDRRGVMIFNSNRRKNSPRRNLLELEPVRRVLERQTGTSEFEIDGVSYIGSVASAPETGWLAIVAQQKDDAYAPVRSVSNLFAAGIIVALAISVLVSVTVSRRLALPLSQLSDSARIIAGGDYETELPVQKYGEIEVLAESLRRMAVAIRDRENILRNLAERMTGSTGLEYLNRIVQETCRVFNTEIALVGRLADGGKVESLAMLMDGEPVDDFYFSLKGSPCERALAQGLCVYPRQVTSLFPDDQGLAELEIEGYIGVPLYDRTGAPMGILNALSRHELQLPIGAEDILNIIASRAEAAVERHRAEEALKISEEKYYKAFQASPVWVVLSSIDEGRYIEVNETFLKTTGYKREEVIGRTSLEIGTWVDPEERARVMDCIRADGSVRNYEVERRTKSGEVLSTLYSGEEILLGGRQLLISVTLDITERKRAEQEKQRLEARLSQAQKIEALGTLAGGIAHDFNNILSAIIGYTDIALFDLPPSSQARDSLNQVIAAGNRARQLIQQILSFSRSVQQDRRPLEITPIVKECLRFLRASIPTTISIDGDIPDKLGTLMADPTQIQQVLMNLGTNAAHAMQEKGGVLTVNMARVEADPGLRDRFPELGPGPFLRLMVSDTGHGMDRETLARIYEPFFSTKGPGEGTGMGLSVVHGIVKSHGGAITVYSEPGQGTSFQLYFPIIDESSRIESVKKESPLPRGDERILLVDDEADLANIGRQMLERLGYLVTSSTSSREALELFRAHPEDFDLVVTDQTMPDMTGMDLARKLVSVRPDIPIIICTGFSLQVSDEIAKEAGLKRFLIKPLSMADTARVVRSVLDESQGKPSPPEPGL